MPTTITILTVIFWTCLALVFYAYAAYPAVIWLLARCFGRRSRASAPTPDPQLPHVSLVIAAYNEETVIAERLSNALAVDYPADRFEIVIGSDGSSDRTAEIVRGFAHDPRVRLLDYADRRGKASVLNSAIAEARGQLVVLSDANTMFRPDALRMLVRWFNDGRVGAVCGKLVLTDPQTGRNVDSQYWRYETFLKMQEGRLGALLGCNGAIAAIRRDLYVPIPPGTLIDDFVIPLLAKIRSGCDIVYDHEAVAEEEAASDIGSEFHRRARIGAGGFQSIPFLLPLLDPRQGWISFTFFSHKVLRWVCPLFLVGMLLTSAALWREPFYLAAFIAQCMLYSVALYEPLLPSRPKVFKLLRVAAMFTAMNAALLVGLFRWLRGSQNAAWKRTDRQAEAAAIQSPTVTAN